MHPVHQQGSRAPLSRNHHIQEVFQKKNTEEQLAILTATEPTTHETFHLKTTDPNSIIVEGTKKDSNVRSHGLVLWDVF
jgi:hypothetical protein